MPIDPSLGFVAFPRGLTDWEWYTEPNTSRVFFHLLLTANYKEKQWHGITIHPGQLVTSRASLAKQLKMSEQSVRTALEHLKLTSYITSKTGSKYSVITINHYAEIVGANQQINQQVTSCQPAANHNLTKRTKEQGNKSSSATPKTRTTTQSLEEEFRGCLGRLSPNGKAELAGYLDRLGEELVREILCKCTDAGGHSWAYVRKALIEAETQGVKSANEYRLTHPLGAGRNQRVDRTAPSGNDTLKNTTLEQSLKRLKKKEETSKCP